jgi:hypothetical protein
VWAAGALLMLARLARNCGRVMLVRRSSRPVQSERLQSLLQEIAARLGKRQVPLLLVSSRTVTPLAAGFGRPAVILPERLLGMVSDSEVRDVVLHEVAHLERGDQRAVLLQELAGALYWPIVPVHGLNCELKRAREEICDNVVLARRDAISYGETLLHVAEVLVGARPMRAAVGIFGGPGELERRVTRLIDPRRNTATRISRRKACSVMFVFIAGLAIASATRFAVSASAAGTSTGAVADDASQNSTGGPGSADVAEGPTPSTPTHLSAAGQADKSPRETESKQTFVFHGKVLGPGDRPIAGARLYLSGHDQADPIELGTSDVNGYYRQAVPARALREGRTGFLWWEFEEPNLAFGGQVSLIAAADGLGPSWWKDLPVVKASGMGDMKREYAHDFRLVADFPVAGRIVDEGGKPVAGAVIVVDAIFDLADPTWFKMHPAIKAGDLNLMDRRESDPNEWYTPLRPAAWRMIPSATTDREGRFKIAGIGRDRAIRLNVTGPGIGSTNVSVLTRDDVAEFTRKLRDKYPGVLLFGPSLTIPVHPARTVAGVVRDATTGKPISGVSMRTGSSYAVTDSLGRYRVLRAEADPSISVSAEFYPSDERYLGIVRRFSHAKGLGEITADFNIPRGVAVTGRVLETGTNRAIVSAPSAGWQGTLQTGYVYYFPLPTNTALRGTPTGLYFEGAQYPGRIQSTCLLSAEIGADGRFRMAVPPGPGVILVRSSPGVPSEFALTGSHKESEGLHQLFPYTELTARAKDDGAPKGGTQSLPGLTGPIPLATYHAYRAIDPPADATKLDVTLTVPRAPSRLLRFVGPDGRAMTGVRVHGLVAHAPGLEVVLDGSEVEILALTPGKPREVVAVSNDGKYTARTFVSADDPNPRTIRLDRSAASAAKPGK